MTRRQRLDLNAESTTGTQVTDGAEVGASKAGDIHRLRTATILATVPARALLRAGSMNEPHSLRSRGRADEDGDSALSRTVLFPIRLTAAERATLGRLAGERGVTVAAFMRAAALGSYAPPRPVPRPVPPINREAYWHLGQVGNNLNQIARRLNMADGDEPTLVEVQRGLEELRGLVQQVRLQLFGWTEPEGQ